MLRIEVEERLAGLLSWGVLGVTLLVTDRISTEPVNVGKMLLLTIVAGGCFALSVTKLRAFAASNKVLTISLIGFLFFALASTFLSQSPWQRGFYGTFGRNTGFLTYFSLSVLFISASLFRNISSLVKVIRALILAGILNTIYCLAVLAGFDIVTWDNIYGKVLGTFGNPDFIAAFLGIFVSALMGLLATRGINNFNRVAIGILIVLSLFIIKKSGAYQGLVVAAVGISIVIFFYLRSKFEKKWILYSYSTATLVVGLVSILGILQKGPLSSLLYKSSISYRGEYWRAGINMGIAKPLTGVGLDSYGIFYRLYREASAAVSPGVGVVTDSAHNVYIDIFAGVGVIGFACYLLIVALVLRSALKLFREYKGYDPIFVILFVTWATYQVQSFISINQIGLAVWGWLLGGAIIGYAGIKDRQKQIQNYMSTARIFGGKKSSKVTVTPISAGMAISLAFGSFLGLLVALPPFLADAKSRASGNGRTVEQMTEVANMWPQDSMRMNRVIVNLANSSKLEEAHSLAAKAVKVFPQDYVAWFTLYQLTVEGTKEKTEIAKILRRLDPYNPEFAPK